MDGSRLGRYVLSQKVGEGSLGVVYRARHEELQRDAAVKVLRPQVRSNPAAIAGLLAEAAALARLDHPNIVALYDVVQEPERTWLAEQWVDGVPLDQVLQAHGRLTPEQALGAAAGALAGLAHAHDSGVVHRDVAASNVLADMVGTSMLVDFGLAAPVEGVSGSGSAGVVGTPAYLSPEAAAGRPVGKAGDVYSAAALTYHLLVGAPVFAGTAWEMVAAHRDRPAPPLRDHGPRLAGLLERSLAKDPSVRPPDAAAFLAELEEAAAERYGAGWRERASIAGLVASTLGMGTAALSGAAGGAPATAAADGVAQAVTGVAQATVATGRRVTPKLLVVGGLTAAVVVGGAVAGVAISGDGDSSGDGDAPSAAEVEEEKRREKVAALEAGAPSGEYTYRGTVTEIQKNGKRLQPSTSTGTLTFSDPDCAETGCNGSISLSGDSIATYAWDGTTLSIEQTAAVVAGKKVACVDTVTGEVQPIKEAAARSTYGAHRYSPVRVPAGSDGSLPDTFSATSTSRVTWEFFGTCKTSPEIVVRTEGTLRFTKKS